MNLGIEFFCLEYRCIFVQIGIHFRFVERSDEYQTHKLIAYPKTTNKLKDPNSS